MRKDSGFTLIELMVTVSVAAILLGVGIPSMQNYMKTNRRAAAVNNLVTDLQRARSAAFTRGLTTIVCRATDSANCAGDGDWSDGWLVFVDTDGDDNLNTAAGDVILSYNENLDLGNEGGMPANQARFIFTPNFRTSVKKTGAVAVCVDDDNSNGRWIVISNTGRPRLETNAGAVDASLHCG